MGVLLTPTALQRQLEPIFHRQSGFTQVKNQTKSMISFHNLRK